MTAIASRAIAAGTFFLLLSSGALASFVMRRPHALRGATFATSSYIKASNTDAGDAFGHRVAISADGDTLAIAAPGEASDTSHVNGDEQNNRAPHSGAVYIFGRLAHGWIQTAYIKASVAAGGDRFGTALALSADGTTLAVGAPGEATHASGINVAHDKEAANAGAAYVFTRTGSEWRETAFVKASTCAFDTFFGTSLALSATGDTLAVGAPGAHRTGEAFVFVREANAWRESAVIQASNAGAGDLFGNALALASDGNILAVGAEFEGSRVTANGVDPNDNSAESSGAVYVFTREAGTWHESSFLKASNGEPRARFGSSLAISADGAVLGVGAIGDSHTASNTKTVTPNAALSGAAYIFSHASGAWRETAFFKAPNADAGDRFGESVSLTANGSEIAVGAIGEASNATGIAGNATDNSTPWSGAVYLFQSHANVWSELAVAKATTAGNDTFGSSVALSSYGDELVVGAMREASHATGTHGDETDASAPGAGAAFIYER